jgi:hypothetical protein
MTFLIDSLFRLICSLSSDLHADFHLFGNAPCELRS